MAINIEQIFERDVAQLRGPTRLIVSRLRAAKMELPQKTVEHLVAAAMESKHVIGVDQRTGIVQGRSFSVFDDRERCKEGMFGWVPFGFEDDLGPLNRDPQLGPSYFTRFPNATLGQGLAGFLASNKGSGVLWIETTASTNKDVWLATDWAGGTLEARLLRFLAWLLGEKVDWCVICLFSYSLRARCCETAQTTQRRRRRRKRRKRRKKRKMRRRKRYLFVCSLSFLSVCVSADM